MIRRRWIYAGLAAIVLSCSSPAPTPDPSLSTPAISMPLAEPSRTPTPIPSPSPSPIALVPVVGFWSATAGISRAGLDAALEGSNTAYRRVLVAGSLPGATETTSDAIRAAVNADPRTLGLLPASDVTPDVRALPVDGVDLFGNDRLRDVAGWPLLVPAATGTDAPSFDPQTTWTLVAGGDVMLDRSIYRRTVRQGKGADEPWD
ncbi:MAG TPA: hypothetical protein VMT36_00875, partial [Candidatus Saccharimonadia bacterium]|nr:hypothetical protein [Candidatus Saccharimonadia bacterium]